MRTAEHRVELTVAERARLLRLVSAGTAPAATLAHARVLLKVDCGPDGPGLSDAAVAEAVEVSRSTVARTRRRFVEQGLEAALRRKAPDRVYARALDGAAEARLVALACGAPPGGRARWTLRLLADKLVELRIVPDVSYETVRRALKTTRSSRG
jgi:transposase